MTSKWAVSFIHSPSVAVRRMRSSLSEPTGSCDWQRQWYSIRSPWQQSNHSSLVHRRWEWSIGSVFDFHLCVTPADLAPCVHFRLALVRPTSMRCHHLLLAHKSVFLNSTGVLAFKSLTHTHEPPSVGLTGGGSRVSGHSTVETLLVSFCYFLMVKDNF